MVVTATCDIIICVLRALIRCRSCASCDGCRSIQARDRFGKRGASRSTWFEPFSPVQHERIGLEHLDEYPYVDFGGDFERFT